MLIIDGYNLLNALKTHAGALPAEDQAARRRFLELVSELSRHDTTKAHVFFDGVSAGVTTGELARPRVRVTFCGPAKGSADAAIRDYVGQHRHPESLKVVTDDHEVRDACRHHGARLVGSRELAPRLARIAGTEADAPRKPEKPQRGVIGKIEREMLDDIGDMDDFERRVLKGEP